VKVILMFELLQFSEFEKLKVWINDWSRSDPHSGLWWVHCLIEPDLVDQQVWLLPILQTSTIG